MKKIILLLIFYCCFGCYDDDNDIIIAEDAVHNTSNITSYIKSISLHNASFDDRIDNTSCSSIVFPYDIIVNSETKTILSIQDITLIDENAEIQLLYPVKSVFFNYDEHQVSSAEKLDEVANVCQSQFTITPNNCFNIIYPIKVRQFNDLVSNFQSFDISNDREFFIYTENLHDNDVFEIDYPISIKNGNSEIIVINSNEEFEFIFNETLLNCI